MSALSLRGVGRSFGSHRVLDDVDLDVATGEVLALLGSSGCGKTTLLRIVAGFLAPDAGTVGIAGREVATAARQVAAQRRRVGYVPQEGALFPHLDVAGNVLFGLPRAQRTPERLASLLELTSLPHDLARARPHELSGGQQQRVALARALAPRPDVVLLDEPFSSLDAALRLSAGRDVVRVLRAAGTTALLVTHDRAEALSLADRVAVMRSGRIAQVADPVSLYTAARDADLASFLGEVSTLEGHLVGAAVSCALGVLPVAATPAPPAVPPGGDAAVRVVVRAEQLVVDDDPALPRAVVESVDFRGPYTALGLRAGATPLQARDTAAVPRRVGDEVCLRVVGPVSVYPR